VVAVPTIRSTPILFHWLMTRGSRDVQGVDASANEATVVTRRAAETMAVMAARFLGPWIDRDRSPWSRMVHLLQGAQPHEPIGPDPRWPAFPHSLVNLDRSRWASRTAGTGITHQGQSGQHTPALSQIDDVWATPHG